MQLNGVSLSKRRSRLFQGMVVVTTGLKREDREAIEELVRKMGGEASGNLDLRTTHLVAATVTSAKYQAAVNSTRFIKCSIVAAAWPQACWEKALRLDPMRFKVKACTGLVIAVTSLDPITRLNAKKKIEKLGATYSKNLEEGTVTHLLSSPAILQNTTDKFLHANQWNIPVVDLRWLDACEDIQAPAPVNDFRIEPPVSTETNPVLKRQLEALEYAARTVKPSSILLNTRIYVPSTTISGDQFKNPFWVACLGLVNKGFGTMVPAHILDDVAARDSITHVVLPPDILPLQSNHHTFPQSAKLVSSDWLLESLKAQSLLPADPFLLHP